MDSRVILGAVDKAVIDRCLLVAICGLAGYSNVNSQVAYMNLRRGILSYFCCDLGKVDRETSGGTSKLKERAYKGPFGGLQK